MRGLTRATIVLALSVVLALSLAASAGALSIAPKAAEEDPCALGVECVTTQPATPAWLDLSGEHALLTRQTLDGTAANEYGSSAAADTTLYGTSTPYSTGFASGANMVDSVLANLAGSEDPGGTYAVVLRSDRTLEVLGSQSAGYKLATSAHVPAEGTLVGVLALAPPPGSGAESRIVVVTDKGFYNYEFTLSPPKLTAKSNTLETSLHGEIAVGDASVNDDPAFTCPAEPLLGSPSPGDCGSIGISKSDGWEFAAPAGGHFLGVYQAPPGKGKFEGATSSVAIAYARPFGEFETEYTVSLFAYEPDGALHFIGQTDETFINGEASLARYAYAISGSYFRIATITRNSLGLYTMHDYDEPGEGSRSPARSDGVVGCPAPSSTGAPTLAVDAVSYNHLGFAEWVTGASVCASVVGNSVEYQAQRTDRGGTGETKTQEAVDVVSTSEHGSFEAPAGDTPESLGATVDFPCDEYLSQFAAHPTPDGFPEVSGGSRYCAPVVSGNGRLPFEPLVGAAGNLAVQFQYTAAEGGAAHTLQQQSVAYEPEAFLDVFDELKSTPKEPFSSYSEQLATLAGSASGLWMLALDPSPITWGGKLLESSPGEVLRTSATSGPVPIAEMAAPPYYAGAEQQVTPTSTTFKNSECNGAGSEQSNTVGVFGGIDASWAEDKYEIEALAKVEASWTQGTEIENCQSFDQQFIAGNFGNNFVADNSLLFRVDTGKDTYLNLTSNSLGVGITGGCDTNHLGQCDPIFVPSGSQYALQSMTQLRHPQPNNFYAADDEQLRNEYGSALESSLPRPGNPSSYPAITGGSPSGCSGQPAGSGSGNPGIVDVNPFVAPTPSPAPNLLEASQISEVNPASGGEEGGTSSTLSYDSTKQTTSSAEFSLGVEGSVKIGWVKFGAEYSHAWGSSMTESFQSGTDFTGGVFDFNGFYDPYSYRLYECRSELPTTPAFAGATSVRVPVFLIDYMAEQSADRLPLNFVTVSLPTGAVGQEYNGQVFASGGVPGYTYSVQEGELPPGLSLDASTGQVAGTPTSDGTFHFTVRAQDSVFNQASEEDSITINPQLAVEASLPEGEVGVPYDQSLGAQGGTPPYTYLLTSSGTVAPGLGINNSAGTLQGTPTKSGTYCFGVYLADSAFPKLTIENQTCVTIGDKPTLSPGTLPQATTGDAYRVAIEGSGGNRAGYVYSATAPAVCNPKEICSVSKPLPAGLSLEPSGSLTAIGGTPTTAGSYEFTITLNDGSGGVTERTYTLTVSEPSLGVTRQAPVFTGADAATVAAETSVSVTIEAAGTPAPVITLSGVLPSGMTFSGGSGGSARISGTPSAGSTGVYTLTLTAQNGVEPAATQSFTLTVDSKPAITTEPADQTAIAPAGDATFTVAANGTPIPTVSWEVSTDGGAHWNAIPAAFSSTLSLTGLEAGDNGNEYRAKFSNSQGAATSSPATLTVDYAPSVQSQPADLAVVAGEDATFAASAAGDPAPDAQWQVSVDGGATWTNVSGASATTLTLTKASMKDDGNRYRVVFSNPRGSTTTAAATLTVQNGPLVTSDPATLTVDEGADATFTAAASGNPTPSVQWQLSTDGGVTWSPVSGGTEAALTVSKVPAGVDGERYEAVFTNPAGSVTSASATLHVNTPPIVTAQPTPQSTAAQGNVTFTAAAGAKPAPTVQWQLSSDDGTTWSDIAGASSPSLTVVDVPAADDGQLYRAVFTNAAGAADTQSARLSVQTAPSVSIPPSGAVTKPGGTVTFTVAITGSPPPSIQWQVSTDEGKTWTDVPGATSPTLQLTGVTASESGYLYRAVISNAGGTVTSVPATLLVSTSAASAAVKGAAVCRRRPPRMTYLDRRLGHVIRYTVYVDGRRVLRAHGRHLRYATIPRLSVGWQAVRIVAVTSKGYRITTRRLYFDCVKGLGFDKVTRRSR